MVKVAKCPFCGKLYEVYPDSVDDQSCCPACRAEAKRNMNDKEPKWR